MKFTYLIIPFVKLLIKKNDFYINKEFIFENNISIFEKFDTLEPYVQQFMLQF
jgi:hypothetical protein